MEHLDKFAEKLKKTSVEFITPSTQHLIAGTIGGLVSTAMLYPLELIKTRMQVIAGTNPTYRSFFKSVRIVLKMEGIRGMYQGVNPALVGAAGSWGGYLYFYELIKSRKRKYQENSLNSTDHLAAGVESGVYLVLLFNPFWVVKTQLALQGAETNTKQYKGMIDAFWTIIKTDGFSGLYKGLSASLMLTSHGAIQLTVYEYLKKLSNNESSVQPAWMSGSIGGISKIIASTSTYPIQVVKSRLQQRSIASVGENQINSSKMAFKPRYSGVLECVRYIYRSQGFIGFFRGLVPSVAKVTPASALTFLVYEEVLKLFK